MITVLDAVLIILTQPSKVSEKDRRFGTKLDEVRKKFADGWQSACERYFFCGGFEKNGYFCELVTNVLFLN